MKFFARMDIGKGEPVGDYYGLILNDRTEIG